MQDTDLREAVYVKPSHNGQEDKHPALIRVLAHLFSFVFHPLFIPTFMAAYLIYVHPYAFSAFDEKGKGLRMISVFMLTAFFPAFTVFLLNKLGFADSIYLRTQKERIIPYIASMFFFFWIFYVSRNLPSSPAIFTMMLLGVFIASIAALMANIYFKVSMHAMAMGGMFAFFLILALLGSSPVTIYLTLAILVAGLVCSARLVVSDHHPFDVYAGFLLGIISQTLALFFS